MLPENSYSSSMNLVELQDTEYTEISCISGPVLMNTAVNCSLTQVTIHFPL